MSEPIAERPDHTGMPRRIALAVRSSSAGRDVIEALLLLLMAFATGAVLIVVIGGNPITAYRAVLDSSFGSQRAVGETLESATPLVFAGLALAVGFRARLLNLGVGSQFLIGALAAAWAGTTFELPAPLHVALLLVVGAVSGALFAGIAAVLKAYRGVHEVISTIMLEYVALSVINHLVNGALQDPRDAGLPQTARIFDSARLPRIFPPSRLSAGIVVLAVTGVVIWWVLERSRIGYEWGAVGAGPAAAELAGISRVRVTLSSLMASGAIGGLGGAVLMSGLLFRYQANTSAGVGLTGLAIALLSRQRIVGVFLAGILFGALVQGQRGMQQAADVPQDMLLVLQGLIVFFVSAPQILWFLRGRWARWRRGDEPADTLTHEPAVLEVG